VGWKHKRRLAVERGTRAERFAGRSVASPALKRAQQNHFPYFGTFENFKLMLQINAICQNVDISFSFHMVLFVLLYTNYKVSKHGVNRKWSMA
jgi:hypothetical protein